MSEKNSDERKKGFLSGLKDGFESFQDSLETMGKKNKETWDQNKDKANKFFKDIKKKWDDQFKKMSDDIESAQQENKSKWDASK